MGASGSKVEEDKALQLCRERKKFVRQALDGRCSLAAAHFAYIQSLRSTGISLRKFLEPQAPVESSLYTSTSATPEPPTFPEKSPSHLSFHSPTQQMDAAEAAFPSFSAADSNQFQVHHMKFRFSSSKKVEEKHSLPVVGTVTSLSTVETDQMTPHSPERSKVTLSEDPPLPSDTPPWDYFGPVHPIDRQFSLQDGKGMKQGLESADDARRPRRNGEMTESEDEEKDSSNRSEESQDSEDEFEEPSNETLIRSFENLNRVHDNGAPNASPTLHTKEAIASESDYMNEEKSISPTMSPLGNASPAPILPGRHTRAPMGEVCSENRVAPKDLYSSIKDIEHLFMKASESGKEVPRMLEANKLHFRPIVPAKQRKSISYVFKDCFSCGEEVESHQVEEEPAQADIKYLTWHRTTSSRSSPSRNIMGMNSKYDMGDFTSNIFGGMFSGSHASTLDRLYAWERKLYDEVKATEMIRRVYDRQRKTLRQLESKEIRSQKIDKTRAVVKDQYCRIRISIQRIDSISKRIEELRDRELQPQLEELIEGLRRMWEVMYECHKLQYHIISVAYNNGSIKITVQSESHRQITIHLEDDLSSLSSSFTKWVGAQKSYLQSIYGWLCKCVSVEEKTSRRKRRSQQPLWKEVGQPIYVTCGYWLELLDTLPTKEVANSIKSLAAETSHFAPKPVKNQGKYPMPWNAGKSGELAGNEFRDEASEEWISGPDRFRTSLVGFIGQLNKFAETSLKMYEELQSGILASKNRYEQHMRS